MNNSYYPNQMFDTNNQIPYQQNYGNYYPQNIQQTYPDDERFFLAPFVVGGLAGTALGYGIANNNQINNNNKGCCMQPVYYYPIPQQPFYSNNNYYY